MKKYDSFLLFINADYWTSKYKLTQSLDFKNEGTAVAVWKKNRHFCKEKILIDNEDKQKERFLIWNHLARERKYR